MDFDPYEVLKLDIDASEKDISKAFRRLSVKCHPDKNPSEEAKEVFHKLTLARDFLLNEEEVGSARVGAEGEDVGS